MRRTMEEKKFSSAESLRFGFKTVFNNIVFFLSLEGLIALIAAAVGAAILGILYLFWSSEVAIICKGANASCFEKYASLQAIGNFFKSFAHNNSEVDANITSFLKNSYVMIPGILISYFVINFLYRFIVLGLVRITLDFYDHGTSNFKRLFSSFSLTLKAFAASILYNAMIVIGTLLFIIPGIIAAIRFGFYQQVLVDKNVGIIDSLKMSAQITKGSGLNIFGVNIFFGLINIAAYFTFGLTYLITLPALYLVQAYIYRKLIGSPATINAHYTDNKDY